MDAKKRIDKLLGAAHQRVQEEVGALLGVEIALRDPRHAFSSKGEFFEAIEGKQILAKIELTGEIEGLGCLVIGIKDAILLGGTLIMLPSSELEDVVRKEEYTPEVADSYGEIANIIAGAYTKVFEEMYPKAFRLVRKEHLELQPMAVDVASEEPVPDQMYYLADCSMTMGERQMGTIHMLLPAAQFGLHADEKVEEAGVESPPPPRQEQSTEAAEPAKPAEPSGTEAPVGGDAESKPAAAASTEAARKFDVVKHRKRVDRLLGVCQQKLTEEVSSLLGVKLNFSALECRPIGKEELFLEVLQGKQIMAELEVAGERSDSSCFFWGLKGAIHAGGTLIMLPPNELESVVSEEEFGEDVKDAYGEIANIIAGVYSGVFEEQYSERLRFIKKDIRQIVPMKVEIETAEPIADESYYMGSMAIDIDGKGLGRMHMLFPARVLQLDQLESSEIQTGRVDAKGSETVPAAEAPSTAREETQPIPTPKPAQAGEPPVQSQPQIDLEKVRRRVDRLLAECGRRMQDEVSSLLGEEIRLDDMENRLIGKEEFFFEMAVGKQVMASLDVVGEKDDHAYLFVSLKDAIHCGGVLIMLPTNELENAIAEEDFATDTKDAYGEIANIISGVYSAVFEEQHTEKMRLVKTGLEQVVPMKVDPDSDEPIPNQLYYMSAMSLSIAGSRKGRVAMLFPAALLHLDGLGLDQAAAVAEAVEAPAPQPPPQPVVSDRPDILIISDDEIEAEKLAEGARERGLATRRLSFKDNIKQAITGDLKAVYIVMREVNEQAFGMAIKVSSASALPLVAAGPAWTRSKVIKAVRYGIGDILLTPASPEDVLESLDSNLSRLAA